MRKIILMMSVSVDGFIEGPDRELDWHMVDDELHSHFNRLYVHPIVIGQGKPLFQPSDTKINLRLAETRTFGNGVVLLRYERS